MIKTDLLDIFQHYQDDPHINEFCLTHVIPLRFEEIEKEGLQIPHEEIDCICKFFNEITHTSLILQIALKRKWETLMMINEINYGGS